MARCLTSLREANNGRSELKTLKFKHNQPEGAQLTVPSHVAIIMDGNGRWANARGLPRVAGHKRGVETVRQLVRDAAELGIEYLTLFSFSSENWQRPAQEINDLMSLLKMFIRRDLANLHKQGVRIRVVGSRQGLEKELVDLLANAEKVTVDNTTLKLVIAFNYGSRWEISEAARKMAEAVQRGELTTDQIGPETFEKYLDTAGIPDPDLLIRTSGEQRLSNFLLWQCAYTEFVFVPQAWPDFNKTILIAAIEEFHNRNRRFGGLSGGKGAQTA